VRPGYRTFIGKKQEKEEHPGGHLAVSSLLFRAKLVLEPSVEGASLVCLFFRLLGNNCFIGHEAIMPYSSLLIQSPKAKILKLRKK